MLLHYKSSHLSAPFLCVIHNRHNSLPSFFLSYSLPRSTLSTLHSPFRPSTPHHNMPLTLHPITTPAALRAIVPLRWLSYETPFNAFFQITCPTHGTRQASLEASAQRHVHAHFSDPSSRWVQIVDEREDGGERECEDGGVADGLGHGDGEDVRDGGPRPGDPGREVIAAAQWHVHERDPYDSDGKTKEGAVAWWWPEGEGREFATQAIKQWTGARRERMRKPHLCIFFFLLALLLPPWNPYATSFKTTS